MLRLAPCPIVLGLLFALIVSLAGSARAEDLPPGEPYRLVIDSELTAETGGAKQAIVGDTELRYSWHHQDEQGTLTFQQIKLLVTVDGKEILNTQMSRDKLINTAEGETTETSFAAAAEELQQLLKDSFDAPLMRLKFDAAGKEVERKTLAGPGAKSMIDTGTFANALIFHPPFPAEDEWDAKAEMPMGNGGFAQGTLHYKKLPGKGPQQNVEVAGTLTNPRANQIADAKYVVHGEQTYDPKAHRWTAGKLTLAVTMNIVDGDTKVGKSEGTMKLTFEKLKGE